MAQMNTYVPIHSRDYEAQEEMGMVLIDEYRFPHCVFPLGNTELNAEGLKYGYNKMANWLGLSKKTHIGVTLIVTPKWMFLAPLERPYHYETEQEIPGADLENGVPVYLDGFSFGGIMNIQTVTQKWPATAGIGNEDNSALDALLAQAGYEGYNPDEEQMKKDEASKKKKKSKE